MDQRPPDFQSTVYSFQAASEDPSHALCRWLRPRKFHLADVVEMAAQATLVRSRAGCPDFYPDGHLALGVEPSVYHTQYPQMYYGYARGGHPLFISKVGQLNAAECDCAIELHLNAGGGNYSRAYYWGNGTTSSVEGLLLARRLHLNKMVVNPSRDLPPQKQSDIPRSLYFLNNTHMPSVIYEPAFMDHPEHKEYIESDQFTADIATTIYRAVREYFEERS